jgi:hypothetical protein
MCEEFDFVMAQKVSGVDVGVRVLANSSGRELIMYKFHNVDVTVIIPGDNSLIDQDSIR